MNLQPVFSSAHEDAACVSNDGEANSESATHDMVVASAISNMVFFMRHIISRFTCLRQTESLIGAHLRFSPMRFEIGNNQNNW